MKNEKSVKHKTTFVISVFVVKRYKTGGFKKFSDILVVTKGT